LGTLAVNACGGEDEASDGQSVPDGGEAGTPGSGGDGATGGGSTGGTGGNSVGGTGGTSTGGGGATGGNAMGGAAGCDPGEFDGDEDASTACVTWSDCAAGQYVEAAGTATSDRKCAACDAGTFSAENNASVCEAWTACTPGQYVSEAGNDTKEQRCTGCTSGSYSAAADASACAVWSDCEAGTYVSNTPSATVDRVCTPCAEDTRTLGQNESVCQPADACPAGTLQTAPGSDSTPPECADCDVGSYCAGGTTPMAACAEGTWDHDENPATVCAAWTVCSDGPVVSEGTPTSDRTCQSGSWISEFGTSAKDRATSVAVDGSGIVYVVGHTNGALPGQTSAGQTDAFLRKYDGAGNLQWTRQFGTSGGDIARSTSVDGSGNVYVVGDTNGTFPGQTGAGTDTFVRKYDSAGNVLWTRQFGIPTETTWPGGVTVDESGHVYVVGETTGTLPDQTRVGANDAYVRKYDSAGNELWTRQFGTVSGEMANSVSVDGGGNVFVAGTTAGELPGQTSAGDTDAFVRKYDGAGNALWTRQFGTTGLDFGNSVAVDASGNAYLAGNTGDTLPGQTSAGSSDAFVTKYDGAGNALWTRQFGTNTIDKANAASVDGSGNAYVAGSTQGGTFAGQTSAGKTDAFVRKYDGTGALQWTRQLGSSEADVAFGMSVEASGGVVMAGFTDGALPGQTHAGDDDAFVLRLVP
jgi:hypothetical protein